ncbi:serine carboxypeptidase-like 2 [Aristolochia californica]|uniref:serine carboxypeptidase-like 2 n=1 Tax=Aristolochia californica TaxID=171875 RepID=UPI0035D63106
MDDLNDDVIQTKWRRIRTNNEFVEIITNKNNFHLKLLAKIIGGYEFDITVNVEYCKRASGAYTPGMPEPCKGFRVSHFSLFVKEIVSVLHKLKSLWKQYVNSSNIVKHLPGFQGPLPFNMETGYVGVGDSDEFQLFYYFVESESNPKMDPLLVWLTGGPGCSALSGFLFEIGPLNVKTVQYDGSLPSLTFNPNSWTQVANVIFLDQPVGTGFSYASISNYSMGDTKAAQLVHQFIRKWLNDHPLFSSNPLYITGDSYSGIIVPIIVQEISNGIETGEQPLLNLKGYILGNPVTDSKYDSGSQVPYMHGMALISDELYEVAKRSCGGDYTNPGNLNCAKALGAVHMCFTGLNTGHILEPLCAFAARKPVQMLVGRRSLYENLEEDPIPDINCRTYGYMLSSHWANNDTVQQALNIRKGSIREWQRCNYFITYKSDVPSSLEYHQKLSSKGYRALVYSGDHDITCPYLGTQAWIRDLNFSIVSDWRSWWVTGQVAGYTRTYSNNMTFATVKGGGHTAPEYRPKECFEMIQRWVFDNPL